MMQCRPLLLLIMSNIFNDGRCAGRQCQVDMRTAAWLRADLQRATGGCQALAHAGQAAAPWSGTGGQADAIVRDVEMQGVVAQACQPDLDARGAGMADDIGQCLLQYAVEQGVMPAV